MESLRYFNKEGFRRVPSFRDFKTSGYYLEVRFQANIHPDR